MAVNEPRQDVPSCGKPDMAVWRRTQKRRSGNIILIENGTVFIIKWVKVVLPYYFLPLLIPRFRTLKGKRQKLVNCPGTGFPFYPNSPLHIMKLFRHWWSLP